MYVNWLERHDLALILSSGSSLIDGLFTQRQGNDLCVNPQACRRISSPNGGCEVGFCNNENFQVCETGFALTSWANDITGACFPVRQGGSRVGDRGRNDAFFEVFVTNTRGGPGSPGGPVTPVPNSRISAAGFYEEEISIEQYKAEQKLRRESYVNGTTVEKRQQPGVSPSRLETMSSCN